MYSWGPPWLRSWHCCALKSKWSSGQSCDGADRSIIMLCLITLEQTTQKIKKYEKTRNYKIHPYLFTARHVLNVRTSTVASPAWGELQEKERKMNFVKQSARSELKWHRCCFFNTYKQVLFWTVTPAPHDLEQGIQSLHSPQTPSSCSITSLGPTADSRGSPWN